MMYIQNLVGGLCCEEEEVMPEPRHVLYNQKNVHSLAERKYNGMEKPNSECGRPKKKYVSPFPTSEQPEKMYEFDSKNDKKYLLIDLDRTLIYYDEENGFIMRPNLNRFLKAMAKFFNIYIFTSATQSYLQLMLQYLSENKGGLEYISGFLTRENCVKVETNDDKIVFVKDINVVANGDLAKIVVVDDLPISYCLNPENAVPILPFEGSLLDNDLYFLSQTLIEIKDYADVRDYIRGRYIFSRLQPPKNSKPNSFQPKPSNESIPTNSTT